MTRRQHELRFLLASALVATLMAILGVRLLSGTWTPYVISLAIILVSNLIWVPAAFWISRGRRAFTTAVLAGAISSFAASVVLLPPFGLAMILERLWSVLAIG